MNLTYDEPLSKFAFKFNLRRYNRVQRYRRESSEFAAPKTRRLHVKVESLMQLIFMKLDQDHTVHDYVYSEDRFRKRLAVIDGKLGP